MASLSLPPVAHASAFEQLMRDLMNHLYSTNSFNLYGVNGQVQHGIDIFSSQHDTIVQCAWSDPNVDNEGKTQQLVQKLITDFDQAVQSPIHFDLFIFASTYKNDKRIHDYCAMLSLRTVHHIEYWSWEKIADHLLGAPALLKKYYPQLFQSGLSIGRITMDNSCNYHLMRKKYCYKLISNANKSDYPILDFSFLNNSEDVVLLNAISVKAQRMRMVHAGAYEKPVGLLDIHAQFDIEPEIPDDLGRWGTTILRLDAPLYIAPKHPARLQVRLLRVIPGFLKFYFEFLFDNAVLTTPDLFFNTERDGAPGIPWELYKEFQERHNTF